MTDQQLPTVYFERSVPLGQYNQRKISASLPYLPGETEASTINNIKKASNVVAQSVLALQGIEYHINGDGVVVEDGEATALKVIKPFQLADKGRTYYEDLDNSIWCGAPENEIHHEPRG